MIAFTRNGQCFNYRVVGAAFRPGAVLLHRADRDPFWSLPGGRGELGEASPATLVREMEEELGETVSVGRLLWAVENFFHYDGMPYHEIAFYHLMHFRPEAPIAVAREDWPARDGDVALTFRWTPLEALADLYLVPSFLRQGLLVPPEHPVHVVHRDGE